MQHQFFITDVFGSSPYTGNQLATFLDAGAISSVEMQRIAREINFSETTFVECPKTGHYKVRIFTPAEEIPFAGHPSLGTAHVIRQHLIQNPITQLDLELKVGRVPISFADDGVVWMDQPEPVFGAKLEAEMLAAVLGLDARQIDAAHPCQIVSTGLAHVIVPLKKPGGAQGLPRRAHSLRRTGRGHWRKLHPALQPRSLPRRPRPKRTHVCGCLRHRRGRGHRQR